ncbi:DUF5808 domain-containing protein [Raineyella sp. LH-20]|uniref:DUF5808 domain-containing protein n=1 Tax=Raineyella sp. LH-20 TaxID=3081204 RepID=UPI002953FA66|nr:DUF5808 domain-containing protein [Raineyella sp. LH-20]WOP19478.1 DUF5808 domain-containing protein [Raineyella sp. LH-20]
MTDPNPTYGDIDTYVAEVARHLKTRGPARHQALADLEAALRETTAAYAGVRSTEESTNEDPVAAAVASFGSARGYARALDEELRSDRRRTILGIPNSLASGVLQRMAATFDPADPHLVVPHVFGVGWALNMGAIAVRLGLLHPDDLDDELLEDATEGPGRWARAMAWTVAGALAVATIASVPRRRRRGLTGRAAWADVPGAASVGAAVVTLAALGSDRRLPPGQRLVTPAYATLLAGIGAAALTGLRPDGSRSTWAGWWGLPLGTALWWAATYGPVRATVDHAVRH